MKCWKWEWNSCAIEGREITSNPAHARGEYFPSFLPSPHEAPTCWCALGCIVGNSWNLELRCMLRGPSTMSACPCMLQTRLCLAYQWLAFLADPYPKVSLTAHHQYSWFTGQPSHRLFRNIEMSCLRRHWQGLRTRDDQVSTISKFEIGTGSTTQ